jgi:hypothetical protein
MDLTEIRSASVLKTDELYTTALSLAKTFDEQFVELAATLRKLQETDPDRYRDFVKASKVGTRKAYYLVSIDRTFRKLKVPKKVLTDLGWTKLTVLEPHVTKTNWKEMLEYAKTHTVADLKQYVKGEEPVANAHPVLMYFNPADYNELMETLLQNGASKERRGIVNKEQALMELVRLARKK